MPHVPHPPRAYFEPRPTRQAKSHVYPASLTSGPTWPLQRWLILHGDPVGWLLTRAARYRNEYLMTKHDHPITRHVRIHFRNGHAIHPVSQAPNDRIDRLERRVADLERRVAALQLPRDLP